MNQFWEKSLLARLVTSFLLLSWVIVSLVAVIAYFRASKALERSVFERLNLAATFKEEELNLWVNERRQDILTIARSPQVQRQAEILLASSAPTSEREAAYTFLAERLNTMLIGKSDLREIFIIAGEDARIVLSTNLASEGQSQNNEKYFVQGQRATFIQNVYAAPETGNPAMTIATPLFNEQAQTLGVVGIHLDLDRVDRIMVERAGMGQTGETYLIDKSSRFVSGQRFGRETFSGKVHSQGIEAALQGTDGSGLYRNYAGMPVIGVYRWIEDRELALLAEMHQQEAFTPARQLAVTIFLVGLASAAALAVGIYVLARQITRPILTMTDIATRVTEGDLSHTVPVLTQDEIGTLAKAFNQMIEQLRDLLDTLEQRVAARTRDLQIAADVSKQITTMLDIDELLQRVVVSTAKSFDLYACLVFLLDDESQHLIGTAGAKMQGHELIQEEIVIPIDAQPSIVALAARTREAVIIADVSKPPEDIVTDTNAFPPSNSLHREEEVTRPPLGGSEGEKLTSLPLGGTEGGNVLGKPPSSIYLPVSILPETHSELAIPMMRGDQLMGVFDLQSSSVNHFSQDDRRVLTTLAEQIAIAVRNAQLFAEIQQARHKAEMASQAKSMFLANVSHELRTPLTSVLGFSKLIRKRLDDIVFPAAKAGGNSKQISRKVQRAIEQVETNFDIIISEGERLTALINDVLDLAKIEAGKVAWNMQAVSMPDIIEQSLVMTAPLFKTKPLELVVDIAEDLPSITGDHNRLVQVIVNLISNAVKFTDKGQIHITADFWEPNEDTRTSKHSLAISVRDSGSGIDPADYGKAFERFEQVGDKITGKPQGSGLGLPICKHIVEHHGGRIWVESEPGEGSCFTFTLPLSPDENM